MLEAKFTEEKTKQLEFTEGDFTCPMCGRTLEPAEITEKQAKMIETFNKEKTKRLKSINAEGISIKVNIDNLKSILAESTKKMEDAAQSLKQIESDPLFTEVISEPTNISSTDKEKQLEQQISEIELRISSADKNSLEAEKNGIKEKIAELQQRLAKGEIINANRTKIADTLESVQKSTEVILSIEKNIDTILEENRKMIADIENQINAKFELTKFKMFQTLVNGESVETCVATFNGIPYADLNYAAKINVGLDIINCLCKEKGVTAPIFIDNSESVNSLLPTSSQQIKLRVSNDKQLILSNN